MASEKTIANTAIGNRSTGPEGTANGTANGTGAGRPAGAAGDVWDALTAHPDGTVADIAAAAQVSRATVARALTVLEGDGRAVRTRGGWDGGRRRPDQWRAVTPDRAPNTGTPTGDATPAAPDADNVPTTDTDPQDAPRDPAQDTHSTGTAPDRTADDATGATADDDTQDADAPNGDAPDADTPGMDAAAVAEARAALTALGSAIGDALTALDRGDGTAALTAIGTVYGGSGRARRLVRAAVNGRARTSSGRPRSLPGEMRAQVAAHLATYPGAEFTPHEIGKALGRSAGAVSNALDRLVEAGQAALVCERPRRFTTSTGPASAAR